MPQDFVRSIVTMLSILLEQYRLSVGIGYVAGLQFVVGVLSVAGVPAMAGAWGCSYCC